jgi:prenyltransferase beta subunit
MTNQKVFISYNSRDAEAVHRLAADLSSRGIICWLDKWSLVPGREWQEEIERALAEAQVVLVLIGSSGIGRWHNEELRTALELRVERLDSDKRVIPVLLPNAQPGVLESLPRFLRRRGILDLGESDHEVGLDRLIAAIEDRAYFPVAQVQEEVPHFSDEDRKIVRRIDITVRRCIQWAQAVQNENGGLPSDNPGSRSCTWATAGLIWAIHATGTHPPDIGWLRRGVTWLLDNKNDDGGIPIVVKGDHSIVDATAQGLLACLPTAVATGNHRILSGCEALLVWLLDHQQTSGGWSWRPGYEAPWTASTAFALLSLSLASDIDLRVSVDIQSAIRSAINWLLRSRSGDSGWGQYSGSESHPAITGLVAHCLAVCGYPHVADETLDYLIDKKLPGKAWPNAIDRPLGSTVIRFGTPYAAVGIASSRSDAAQAETQDALAAIMKHYQENHFTFEDSSMHTWPTRDCLYALSVLRRHCIEKYRVP